MKILAIDTSGLVAGVALAEDDVLRAEFTLNDKKTHSQTLLPMLEQLRRMIGLELDTVDAIAVAAGPGSFTGLASGRPQPRGWDWRCKSRWWRCPLWRLWPTISTARTVWCAR